PKRCRAALATALQKRGYSGVRWEVAGSFGVRRQCEAATALWISRKPSFLQVRVFVVQSGVALRLPPHSKSVVTQELDGNATGSFGVRRQSEAATALWIGYPRD
ncbi:MAG: hypothetical protein ACREBG_05230, partial [Pyrinomonadaceae bacterium]